MTQVSARIVVSTIAVLLGAASAYAGCANYNDGSIIKARFDRIFRRRSGFVMLDRLLARLHANKAELLMALRRPEVPLHTNGSENDVRCQVTRRKISAGTRSDDGRDSRVSYQLNRQLAGWNLQGPLRG